MPKTYGEYCGLARSLDRIGDRWTLLIVRELLVRPARYRDLQDGLPGIATNLLAQRLHQLEQDGIVLRRLDDEGGGIVYALTSVGADLEPTVMALVRWGTPWMQSGQGDDTFRPSWLVVALRALLTDEPISSESRVEVSCHGEAITVTRNPEGLTVALGGTARPHATLTCDPGQILGLAARVSSLEDIRNTGARVEGSAAALRRALFAGSSATGVTK